MNSKWFIVNIGAAFAAGIIFTIIISMIFTKPVIQEKVIYTNSITTVDVNESAAIKNMARFFNSLSDNDWMNFSIYYHAKSGTWRLNLNYDEREYKQEFKSYDDFILFISDKKLYYDGIMDLGK